MERQELKPTLPGMVQGIIAIRNEGGRDIHTLQCQDCGATEEPQPLITMTFKFLHCRHGKEAQRRCKPCTRVHLETCDETLRIAPWMQ